MIIESGMIVFAGLLLMAWKLPLRTSLWLLGHALLVDLVVTVLTFVMHYGTFTGVMAAAVAGLLCSGFTTVAAKTVGYISSGKYYRGAWWDLSARLAK